MKSKPYVVRNSTEVRRRLEGKWIPPGHKLFVIDAKNLYPSLPLEALFLAVALEIRIWYNTDYALAIFAIRLLHLVLYNQTVSFDGVVYLNIHGLATGIAAGVSLANIFLSGGDPAIASHPAADEYHRYIDDSFLVSGDITAVLAIMNSFHPDVIWEIQATGEEVPFLDLLISIGPDRRLSVDLYRKPQNRYMFVPASSCHPTHCLDGIARSEATRIARLAHPRTRSKHLAFLEDRLVSRGFTRCRLRRIFRAVSGSRVSRPPHDDSRRFAFHIKHGSSVPAQGIRKVLQRHSVVLKRALHRQPRFVLARHLQPSIGLRRYRQNWPNRVG